MILVVFGHVEHYGYGYIGNESVLRTIISTFRMPLFFFISGFIAFRGQTIWDRFQTKTAILKKARVQLIPTFFFGILFSITVYASQRGYSNPLRGIGSFVVDGAKNGYWFTISLLEMFVCYYLVCHFGYLHSFKTKKDYSMTVLIVLSLLFFVLSLRFSNENLFLNGHLIGGKENYFQLALNVLCLPRTFKYFQFFVFGNIVAHHKEKFFKLVESRYFFALALLLWMLAFGAKYKTDNGEIIVLSSLIVGYCGIIILLSSFYIYQNTFLCDKKIGQMLQYVGKRTLDIYLIHFFLLPTLPKLGAWLVEYPNITLEFFVTMLVSIMIVVLCLVISNLIRTSAFLEHYLFGVKNSKFTK